MSTPFFSLSAIARKSLADVTRRKGRTILVVLGIMIGVFGLTSINVASSAVNATFDFFISHNTAPKIVFSVQQADQSLVSTLETIPNVKTVQIDTTYATRWHIQAVPGHAPLTITGFNDFQAIKLNTFQLTSGRFPTENKEIVMEGSDRSLQNIALGDTITVDSPSGTKQVRIVGLSRTEGVNVAQSGTAVGYMGASALSQLSGQPIGNTIGVQVYNKNQANQTAKALSDELHAQSITVYGSTVAPEPDPSQVTGLLTIMLALSLIALLLTAFLIINTISTLMVEQTKIIGTMKAIGGSRWAIIRGYLLSTLIYGLIGTALGLALGVLAGYGLASSIASLVATDLVGFQVTPSIVLISIAVGLGIPLLAALLPLFGGTRISVHDAMMSYGTANGHTRVSRRHSGRGFTRIAQSTRLAFRSIFRRRVQAILTLLALTLSGTAFLAIQTTSYSFDQLLGTLFQTYNFDAEVGLARPQPYNQIQTLVSGVPNVGRVERVGQGIFTTKSGSLTLTGVETDTQLYRYKLTGGRWFQPNDTNVLVLSESAAGKSNLKVGDSLTFASAISTAHWKIIGTVDDKNNAGAGLLGVGLTPVNSFNSFVGLPATLVQSFEIQGIDRSAGAVDRMARQVDDNLSSKGLSPTVTTAPQIIARNQSVFLIINVLLYSVAGIVALIGILGLFNTLTTSVLERRREIGILRSLGASGRWVASIFWLEGISLATIAWVLAILLGIPAAYGFVTLIQAVFFPIPFSFDPKGFIVMLLLILVIATLASIGPTLRASRSRIVDILRYE